jgi:hypothetical protein
VFGRWERVEKEEGVGIGRVREGISGDGVRGSVLCFPSCLRWRHIIIVIAIAPTAHRLIIQIERDIVAIIRTDGGFMLGRRRFGMWDAVRGEVVVVIRLELVEGILS